MITPDYCHTMARYNAWMNEKLYTAAATLTDDARKRNVGAFFKSLHGTLAHLLLGDVAWLRRIAPGIALPVTKETFTGLDEVLYDNFEEMRSARTAVDRALSETMATLRAPQIASVLTYTRVNGASARAPMDIVLIHLFNHQTHHRGQATTILMQLGVDPGETDVMWLPGVLQAG